MNHQASSEQAAIKPSEDQVRDIERWLVSDECRQALADAAREAKEFIEKSNESNRLDWREFHRPIVLL